MTIIETLKKYGLLPGYYNHNSEWTLLHCPFHNDNSPSLSMHIVKGKFKCFGCNETGSFEDYLVKVIKRQNNISNKRALIEAKKILQDVPLDFSVGITKTEEYEADKLEKRRRATVDAFQFYQSLEIVDWRLRPKNYLIKERGFTSEVLNNARIKVNDSSINPLIIPLVEDNSFVGYVARRNNAGTAKYKNNPGFSHKNVLVGHVYKSTPLIVVEGVLDFLRVKQHNYKNVVALMGGIPSMEQLEKMKGAKKIVWCTDNDEIGEQSFFVASKELGEKKIQRYHFPIDTKDLCDIMDKQEFLKGLQING